MEEVQFVLSIIMAIWAAVMFFKRIVCVYKYRYCSNGASVSYLLWGNRFGEN